MRDKLLAGAGWIGAANLLVNVLGIVSTLILARLLMPQDFGVVAIAVAVLGIVSVVTELSLSQALIQHDGPQESHFNTAWTMNAIRGAILALIIILLAEPLAAFYRDERLTDIVRVVAITVAIGSLANPKLVVFHRRLQFHQVFVLQSTAKAVGFAVTIGLAFYMRSYWALIIGSLVAEFATVATSFLLLPFRPRPRLREYRELLSFSIWLTAGRWVQAANWRADPLVLGYFLPVGLLGQYSVGNKISSQSIGQIVAPIQQLLFPALSRLKREPERFRRAYLRSQGILCLLLFPLGIGFSLLATEVVLIALGPKWIQAIVVVQVLALTTIMQKSENLNPVAMASGETKRLFGRDLRAFAIRWPLVLAGVFLGSGDAYDMLVGALLGRAAAVLSNALLNMNLITRITEITWRDQLLTLWKPILASAVMALAVAAARLAMPGGTQIETLLLRLAGLVTIGGVTYVAFIGLLWLASGRREGVETETVTALGALADKLLAKLRRRGSRPA